MSPAETRKPSFVRDVGECNRIEYSRGVQRGPADTAVGKIKGIIPKYT
jgi:hypothetical protein